MRRLYLLAALPVLASCTGITEPGAGPVSGTWVSVSAGGAHTCALDSKGRVACWGANDRGQAGTGAGGDWVQSPTYVASGITFASVSAGGRHTCGLDGKGQVWCWGANDMGQLGDGTFSDRSTPVRVQAPDTFTQVSAGWDHTCAVSRGGTILCWGDNVQGQAGIGQATQNPVPPTAVRSSVSFSEVSAGRVHTCAIATTGSAFCWGANGDGVLGEGTLIDSPLPTLVVGAHTFVDIVAGDTDSCAMDAEGMGWCWGPNSYGQVTAGSMTIVGTPGPRSPVALVSLGVGDSWTCALAAAGYVTCWGVRWDDPQGTNYPVDRAGWQPSALAGKSAQALSVGARHACALLDTGQVVCWGQGVKNGPQA